MTATEFVATEYVILVDANNKEVGSAEKLVAHQENLLHRAFSIFIFRLGPPVALLLQQRALHKYHSPGLWTNSCCSHPRPGETITAAGERRLREELNISTSLENLGWFHYNVHFSNGLSENENDHVLIGSISTDQSIQFNADEIHAYRWITPDQLEQELIAHPTQFTPWLKKAWAVALPRINQISALSAEKRGKA